MSDTTRRLPVADQEPLALTARMLIPFVLVYGVYVIMHGELGPGGGFQGGVILAAAYILHALVYGIPAAQRVLPRRLSDGLAVMGVLLYTGVGVITLFKGGNFLAYDALDPHHVQHGQELGMTLVEIGVGITVAAVMVTVFNEIAEDYAMDLLGSFNFVIYVVLMMIGLYAALAKQNMVKKVLGLSLFQTGIFIFYISLGVVDAGTAPIRWSAEDPGRTRYQVEHLERLIQYRLPALRDDERRQALAALADGGVDAALAVLPTLPAPQQDALDHLVPRVPAGSDQDLTNDFPYSNPLPHVLILTAIVVSVSTMAVALAIVICIKREFGTVHMDEVAALNEAADAQAGGEA